MSDSTRPEGPRRVRKHSQARRRLLKTLAVGTGAAAAATVVPTTWVKPVVDTIEVPLHAQGTVVASMTCTLTWEGITYTEGSHVVSADADSGSVDSISAEIDPAVAGQAVNLEIVPNDNDLVIGESDQSFLTDDLGQVDFNDAALSGPDLGNGDAVSGFVATFSSPGVPDCVISISFSVP